MPMVNVTAARTHLSRLLAQVEHGEEVVITRNKEPVAKLVAFQPQHQRRFGALRGRISLDERFFEPLPEDELAAWEA